MPAPMPTPISVPTATPAPAPASPPQADDTPDGQVGLFTSRGGSVHASFLPGPSIPPAMAQRISGAYVEALGRCFHDALWAHRSTPQKHAVQLSVSATGAVTVLTPTPAGGLEVVVCLEQRIASWKLPIPADHAAAVYTIEVQFIYE